MTYGEFELKTSPFHKIDEFKPAKSGERVSVRTDIAPEDYRFVEKYINNREGFDNSKFVKELIKDFLNNFALDKRSIDDIYFILLLPKTQDPEDMEIEGEIVGLIEDENAFYTGNPLKYHKTKNEFNFIFYLDEFNERGYKDLLMLYHGKEALFFDVSKDIQHDFLKVKKRLSEVYHEIDLDECYFTLVNINNYLDVLNEGQYTYRDSKVYHEGLITLITPSHELKVCMTCQWCYFNDNIEVSFIVEDEGEFNESIIYRANNPEIKNEYYSITIVLSKEGALERQINSYKVSIDELTRLMNEKQALLDEIRNKK